MLNAITTKLEIDVMHIGELDQAIQLAAVHNLPAIVIHPQMVDQALATRIRRNGRFKLITTVDWPKGDTYGTSKLRGTTKSMMQLDGYEILMTGGRTEAENKSEAGAITEFIRKHINSLMEVRFVLGSFIRPDEEIARMVRAMASVPAPALLRNDAHLRMQATKASAKAHCAAVANIRKHSALPLKIGGNIDSLRTITSCLQTPQAPIRFAVSLPQFQQIVKDLQKQPEELKQMLAVTTPAPQPAQAIVNIATGQQIVAGK